MRNSALEKMKWNTQYEEDFHDVDGYIGYNVKFSQDKIIHESYSGVYTYEIKEIKEMKTLELNEEQIRMIVHALRTTIRVNQESVDDMYRACGRNSDTQEVANRIIEGNISMRTLINYLEA